MKPHATPTEALLSELNINPLQGLTAEQVQKRREEFGENKLTEKKKKNFFQRFISQFKDVMILILIGAAAISFVLAGIEGEAKAFFEPSLILFIVLLNAFLGTLQESKAEKALEALKSMSAPHARVIRDGKEEVIDAVELVPGDIIKLEAGDFIPADARLLHSSSLKSEESALTGESVASEKDASVTVAEDAPIGDRTNTVFLGCSVTYGTAVAVVTGTGMQTEMGRIANLLDGEEEGQTPLQKKLADLGKYLGIAALVACAVVFVVGIISKMNPLMLFMTAVSLAVCAIPEGLPAIVTIVLSIGVQRMVKKNAIIRRLPAVETLGSASVICSDKTGTLTQNRMTLTRAYTDSLSALEEIGTENSESVRKLLLFGTLCCNGSVSYENDVESHLGDPTETAIVAAAHKNGIIKESEESRYPRLYEIPFDSDRKLMSTVNLIDGKKTVIVKGAFDELAKRAISGDLERAEQMTVEMGADALRVLAVAYKEISELPAQPTSGNLETELHFLGLVGMIDPPRPEAKDAVATCRIAGIKPVMITGDHIITASAIAKELGILEEGDRAVTGAELNAMSDEELSESVNGISVYARVSPENKIRIVKAWQKRGEVVSMTGDGVNDAPALKAADIGCAMGITGTDVAKGAADMTLTDDNFATIVDAVKEGRSIYANIKKVVGFLLGTNIGEILLVFIAMLIWKETPLISMQLLWINLVTDTIPAIALGMEGVENDIMSRRPKPKNEGIFAHGFGLQILLQGVMFGALSIGAYAVGKHMTGTIAGGQTLCFMVMALAQVIQSMNMRSNRSLFQIGFLSNKKLNSAFLISFALTLGVMLVPGVNFAFGFVFLPYYMYLIGLAFILIPFVVMEIAKAFKLVRIDD